MFSNKLFIIQSLCFVLLSLVGPSLAEEIEQEQLITPSALDILNHIENKPVEAQETRDGLILNFQTEITALSSNQKTAILKVFSSLKNIERIAITSSASQLKTTSNRENTARRISLECAIITREFLRENGYDHIHIDIFPLGLSENSTTENHVILQHVAP